MKKCGTTGATELRAGNRGRLPLLSSACIAALFIVGLSPAFAGDANVKNDFKRAGHAIGSAAREVGHDFAEAGRAVGHGAKKGAKEVGHAAKEGGHEIKEGFKELDHKINGER